MRGFAAASEGSLARRTQQGTTSWLPRSTGCRVVRVGFNEIPEAWQNWTCPTAPRWILWQAGPDLTAEGPPEGSSATRQSRCPPAPPLSAGGRRHVPAMSPPPSRGREAPWALPSPEGRLLSPGPGGGHNFFLWGKWVISAHPVCRH